MSRRIGFSAVLAAALGMVTLMLLGDAGNAQASGHGQHGRCDSVRDHAIAVDTRAEVYRAHGTIYGCIFGRRPTFIGAVPEPSGGNPSGVQRVALGGAMVAYVQYELQKYGGEQNWRVVVENLQGRRVVHRVPTAPGKLLYEPPGQEGVGTPESLIVNPQGEAAWIVSSYVECVDSQGLRQLAESEAIATKSLAIAGSTVYWTQEGAPRSALLE
jgi:hypothetical protein